jgi:mono/diheme cytochrome c family protein
MSRSPLLLFASALGIAALDTAPARALETNGEAFFEANIRPLLLERCAECHGETKQKGGLRLDSKAAWQRGGDSGTALTPGNPEASLLLKAVRYADSELQMPPKKRLDPAEVALLEEWIKMGAPDPRTGPASPVPGSIKDAASQHWAFQPVRRPAPPDTPHSNGPAHPVDAFVSSRLDAEGLAPNSAADHRTLIRRATYDLTGLPPTPEEIRAFLEDASPGAFERVVERLLASKAYGERWGRHWLDVARYADTAGDGADYPVREAAKYRDWVIQSFNEDKPYDAFLREQIAGDILARNAPPETLAPHVTATGFLAVGKRYGYKPSPDFQHLDFADAIDSLGRSLLGLSIGCARCHDHKFDPITMADYYGMYGIFQSTQWAFPGGEEQKRPSHFPPLVPPGEAARLDGIKTQSLARLDEKISRAKKDRANYDVPAFAGGIDLAFEGQTAGKPPGTPWLSAGPNLVQADAQSPFAHVHPRGKLGVRLGSSAPNDGVRYVFTKGLRATPGKTMEFTIDFRTAPSGAPSGEKDGSYRFYLGRGVIQSQALEVSVSATELAIRNGTQWEVVRKLAPGHWNTLRLTLDPGRKTYSGIAGTPGDLTTFENKALGAAWDGVADTFICDGNGHVKGTVPARDLDNLGLQESPFGPPGSGPVAAPVPPAGLAEKLKALDAEIAQTTKERDALSAESPYPVAYGVSEGTPVNARIQHRGEPEKPREEVPRRFLEVLGGDLLPQPARGSGRLELADWITRPSNPLTARVFVNRVWQWHFGTGLVPSASDFGLRGDPPSHPELLDWLAAEFTRSGWSLKNLHRLILRTAAYQRSSADNPVNLKKDPSNRWLWRFERRPLDAESIRDSMLSLSGLMDRSVPGGHPFPAVQTWAFTIHRPFHEVYESHHRSVYLMVQRNRRHPFLSLFDGADPNTSVPRRQPTTTPTQALYLLNSPFVQEQAKGMARRLLALPLEDAARVRLAFESAHARQPAQTEVDDTLHFIKAYHEQLAARQRPGDAPGESAWSGFTRVLLTANAFLYLD